MSFITTVHDVLSKELRLFTEDFTSSLCTPFVSVAVNLFKELTAEEEIEFRQWARDNYICFSDISGIWHTVVQDECQKMNGEAYLEDVLRVW